MNAKKQSEYRHYYFKKIREIMVKDLHDGNNEDFHMRMLGLIEASAMTSCFLLGEYIVGQGRPVDVPGLIRDANLGIDAMAMAMTGKESHWNKRSEN